MAAQSVAISVSPEPDAGTQRVELAEHSVNIVSGLSGELICSLQCPGTTTILDIKQRIKAEIGTSRFCQSLFMQRSSSPLAAETTVASLQAELEPGAEGGESAEPLILQLMKRAWNMNDAEASHQIIEAAHQGRTEEVEELLAGHLCPNVVNTLNKTALHIASECGHFGIACLMVEAGIDLEIRAYHSETAVFAAAAFGHLEIVKLLIASGSIVDAAAQDGWTALTFAAKNGYLEIVEALVEAGADVNLTLLDGTSALHFAARGGHLEVARFLIKAGINVDGLTRYGHTAMHFAARNGHTEVIRLLVGSGGDMDAMTEDGDTALRGACWKGDLEAVKILVQAGCQKEMISRDGTIPLYEAYEMGHLDIVQLLLREGVDKGYLGWPALLAGMLSGHLGMVSRIACTRRRGRAPKMRPRPVTLGGTGE